MTIHSGHPFPTPDDPVRRLRGRLGGTVSLWTAGDDVERVARYESHLMRRLSALITELTFMQARRLANGGGRMVLDV